MTKQGIELIKNFLKTSPTAPGVYRMLDHKGNVLYIGKAKNIANRLSSYANFNGLSDRIISMINKTSFIEVIITKNEIEALLLEASLIKNLKPKFNILLKDDKSFPYILLRQDHEFGQILKHRGAKKYKGKYFGPFASISDVNNSIETLQRIFMLRTCSDHFFASRTRPCIQYEIKRCSAPCTIKIAKEDYQKSCEQAEKFLNGKSSEIQKELHFFMSEESKKLNFEKAALLRDKMTALNNIQAKNSITFNIKDSDIIAIDLENNFCAIQIFFFRAGQNYGNKSYFPEQIEEITPEEILSIFIADFYQHNSLPKEILVNATPTNHDELEEIFKTKITKPKSGDKLKIVDFAFQNAKNSLETKISKKTKQENLFKALANLFNVPNLIHRIDVFDNSHISGKFALSAMIVSTIDGFSKKHYRVFDIKGANKQDDYAMMKEGLTRGYLRMLKECPSYQQGIWPDLIVIDGGPGHLSIANEVFQNLKLKIPFICVAKGDKRNAGGETFYQNEKTPINLENNNIVMQFIQNLRDEAHRFAITKHRNKRDKDNLTSMLDKIPNIGPARKKILLQHFGSAKKVAEASITELNMVESIDAKTAEVIYKFFREYKP